MNGKVDKNGLVGVATDDGLITFRKGEAGWQETGRTLAGRRLTCLASQDGVILAGAVDGLLRSEDLGQNWEEIGGVVMGAHARWLAFHDRPRGTALLGTEPAAVFQSTDAGLLWGEGGGVTGLRDRHGWYLPYSPESGCVRGFAGHGTRIYAAVEVGGLLRSDDLGRKWQLVDGSDGRPRFGRPAEGMLHPDVHSINVHPSAADLLYAPTGGGFYVSEDGGRRWEPRYEDCYCRAVWVDPDDPDHMILGPADNVDRGGRIEESHDRGRHWKRVDEGLGTPWPRTMVERFARAGDELFALLSNGDLYVTPLADRTWRQALAGAPPIRALAQIR